jgi:hypothetical protein
MRLRWELGSAEHGCFLALTPEGDLLLAAFAATVVDRAPRVPGWSWSISRPPRPLAILADAVRARTGAGIEGWRASAEHGDERGLEVTCYVPRREIGSAGLAERAQVVVAELLGEHIADRWVHDVYVTSSLWPRGRALAALPARVEALMAEVRALMDPEPHWKRRRAPVRTGRQRLGTSFKLRAPAAPDYAQQRDLRAGSTTADRAWWVASHRGGTFASERFSRFGETFCYVKLDGTQGMEQEIFRDRGAIEDALDGALDAQELGCALGGGTGMRYSYIDLALVDVPRAIDVVLAVLREGRVPPRSWLHFFDVDQAAEWIGVYPDSPAPPMPWTPPEDLPGEPITTVLNRREVSLQEAAEGAEAG